MFLSFSFRLTVQLNYVYIHINNSADWYNHDYLVVV